MNTPNFSDLTNLIFGEENRRSRLLLTMHPQEIEFGTRARNAITSAGITRIGDLIYAREYLATVRNCGEETLSDISLGLQAVGVDFRSPSQVFDELCKLRRYRERTAVLVKVSGLVCTDSEITETADNIY